MGADKRSWNFDELVRKYGFYLKLGFLISLTFTLLIPLQMIGQQVGERKERRDMTVARIATNWGDRQSVVGPVLVIPYSYKFETLKEGRIVLFPETYRSNIELVPAIRYRGIYKAVVYRARIKLTGHFDFGRIRKLGLGNNKILWNRARLVIGLSELKSLRGQPAGTFGGSNLNMSGDTKNTLLSTGISAPLNLRPETTGVPTPQKFAISFALVGSGNFEISPVGSNSHTTIKSVWPHPMFNGPTLPDKRTIGSDGFEAYWQTTHYAQKFPRAWISFDPQTGANSETELSKMLLSSDIKVALVTPVDLYLKSERALKYGILFIVLVVATVFSFEVAAGLNVHAVQYTLVGAALCVFYLLLLSLSEVVAFSTAYLVAATMATSMVALYIAKIAGGWKRGATMAVLLGTVYGFLYVVLQLEDYALLVGSLGVFVALAAIMYATRNVDWYGLTGTAAKGG